MKFYQGEPLDVLHAVDMDKLYPIIRIHFTIQGDFNRDRFKKALGECGRVIPELFCKYILTNNKFASVTSDLTGVLFEDKNPDQDSANWDLLKEPQLRVYLNKRNSEDEVTIFLSHILTDGSGAKQFLALLARAYNKGTLAGIKNHRDIKWLYQLLKDHPVKVKKGTDYPLNPLLLPTLANQENRSRLTANLTFTQKETRTLIRSGHNCAITLNDLFMAAYGRAVQRFSNSNRIALVCPTDMRKFIPVNPEIRVANFTSRYNIDIAANQNMSFEKVVRLIHKAMDFNKKTYQCLESVKNLVDNYELYSFAKLQKICRENYHIREISYTNFGVINFALNGCQIAGFNMLGGYRQAPMFQVAVSTYNDKISFAYAMVGTEMEARLGMTVMKTMHDLLNSYALKFA